MTIQPNNIAAKIVAGSVDAIIPHISVGVFFEHQEIAELINVSAADRRMKQAQVSLKAGGIAAAADWFGHQPLTNLVIVEATSDTRIVLAQLDALAEVCTPNTNIIVIGWANDVALFRALVERGVSDYLLAPFEPLALINSIARTYRESSEQCLGRITAFIGAKGGVGSSTVSANVAACAADLEGPDVLLVDLNLPFGSTGLDLNVDPVLGVAEIIAGSERIDDVLLERLATRRKAGLRVLASSCSLNGNCEIDEGGVERLLQVARSASRHLMLDLPQMWSPWLKESLRAADEIVITATPDLVSMRNTKNMVEFLTDIRPNDSAPRLVLNQVGMPKRPEIKAADFSSAVTLDVSATIPFAPAVFGRAANEGRLAVDTWSSTQELRRLARAISGQKIVAPKNAVRSFVDRLMGRW